MNLKQNAKKEQITWWRWRHWWREISSAVVCTSVPHGIDKGWIVEKWWTRWRHRRRMRPIIWSVDGAGLVLHGHAKSGRTVAASGRLRAVVVQALLDVVGRMPLVKPMMLLLLLLLQGGMELVVLVTVLKGRSSQGYWINQLVLLVLLLLLLMLLLLMWTAAAGRTTWVVVWLVKKGFGERVVLDLQGRHIFILKFKISFH